MKKLILFAIAFFLTTGVFAQDCSSYLYLQKDKTIEMSSFSSKKDLIYKGVSKVTDVSTVDGTTSAKVTAQAYDKDGKLMGANTVVYKCNGGVMMIDMNFNMPTAQQGAKPGAATDVKMDMKFEGGFQEYPASMNVGDHLKDAQTEMEVSSPSNNTMNSVTTIKVTDRVVQAKESVTTPAGTWDCFKITYKTTTSTKLGGSRGDSVNTAMNSLKSKLGSFGMKLMPANNNVSESTVWYAPNVGIIKIQTKSSITEITAIN